MRRSHVVELIRYQRKLRRHRSTETWPACGSKTASPTHDGSSASSRGGPSALDAAMRNGGCNQA